MKNLCLHVYHDVIISCTCQLKESDGYWMRNMSSGLHVDNQMLEKSRMTYRYRYELGFGPMLCTAV